MQKKAAKYENMLLYTMELTETTLLCDPLRCAVLYSYKPRRPEELELRKGEMVGVYGKFKEGWLRGLSLRTGKVGILPSNYVSPVLRWEAVGAEWHLESDRGQDDMSTSTQLSLKYITASQRLVLGSNKVTNLYFSHCRTSARLLETKAATASSQYNTVAGRKPTAAKNPAVVLDRVNTDGAIHSTGQVPSVPNGAQHATSSTGAGKPSFYGRSQGWDTVRRLFNPHRGDC